MADPNPPGARPGAPRPLTAGQRPTGPTPATSPAPGPGTAPPSPPPAHAPSAGPVLSAARPPTSSGRAALGAAPPSPSGAYVSPLSPEIAARSSGPKIKAQPKDVKQALREGAVDTILNAAGILADTWDDFRRQDRYFKYKAMIIGAWAFLTITSFFIAFPGSGLDAKNRLGAQLIEAGDKDRPVFMIRNNSRSPWREVIVVANGHYRTAVGTVEPNGGTLTFIPKQLKGDNDIAAPPDMKVTDLQLRTEDGNAWLKKDGEAR
ncbi:MAG TPA: hypothetical protein VND93_14275 [Myxococcales bacterium]|nr:hypothetical protein [Myxococcales bacterium]